MFSGYNEFLSRELGLDLNTLTELSQRFIKERETRYREEREQKEKEAREKKEKEDKEARERKEREEEEKRERDRKTIRDAEIRREQLEREKKERAERAERVRNEPKVQCRGITSKFVQCTRYVPISEVFCRDHSEYTNSEREREKKEKDEKEKIVEVQCEGLTSKYIRCTRMVPQKVRFCRDHSEELTAKRKAEMEGNARNQEDLFDGPKKRAEAKAQRDANHSYSRGNFSGFTGYDDIFKQFFGPGGKFEQPKFQVPPKPPKPPKPLGPKEIDDFTVPELYTFLKLKETCTNSELRKAFLKYSVLYHPDKGDEKDKAVRQLKFTRMKAAYDRILNLRGIGKPTQE